MSKIVKVALPLVSAVAVLLGGCAVEFQNKLPAQEIARQAQPPGSVYVGWRVFQSRCAACHGQAATGSAGAPDLLPLVRDMGARRFLGLVLQRYDWGVPVAQARQQGQSQEALLDDIEQRRTAPLTMPAWQGEPVVTAHIADVYAYLSARAQGTQGLGRPQ